MKGTILDFSTQLYEGIISGDDGKRYKFSAIEWKDRTNPYPQRNVRVDFDVLDGKAVEIYIDTATANVKKSRTTAAIWAFLLGAFGAHKYYLGLNGAATIMLVTSLVGSIFVVPTLIMAIIAFIEFIIYLTISDSDFEQKYLINKKRWF